MTNKNEAFILEPNSKVTWISQIKNGMWNQWKIFKDCTKEEKAQINLASYPTNTILFDRDLPGLTENEINEDYSKFKEMLIKRQIKFFYSYRSPKGYHIIAPFKELENLEPDLKKEVKKYYVSLFQTDPAKISDRGIVSLPGKPHFKNEIIYDVFEWNKGENEIHESVMNESKQKVQENKNKLMKMNKDIDFENYFEKDLFWKYISTHIIPDGTGRDINIFPNIAIAASKTGKTMEEIKEIIGPIIKKNFPGKSFAEFSGWLSKALKNEITDYNPYQINTWLKTYSENKKEIYDLKDIIVEQLTEEKKEGKERFKIYFDKDLCNIQNSEVKWLIENWLAAGDISFLAGKAGSFKTTLALHAGYAVSEGLLFVNKYKTIKTNVLYLNEENGATLFLQNIGRVKKGLGLSLSKTDNIAFSILENIKFDKTEDLKWLIKWCREMKIGWIICDSLRRFISFDENSATEMSALFNNFKMLRHLIGAVNDLPLTLTILHHSKKEQSNTSSDPKDSLRGSSDIVNNADSIIMVKRRGSNNSIQLEQIKNRAGEEMTNKLIIISSGENKDEAYFYESDKELDIDKQLSTTEKCGEQILKYFRDKNITNFRKKDIICTNHSESTISRALSQLVKDGILQVFGSTTNRQYFIQEQMISEEVQEEPEEIL